jgi:hypothetical protein
MSAPFTAENIGKGCKGCASACGGTGLVTATDFIALACCDTGNADTRAFSAENWTIAIP